MTAVEAAAVAAVIPVVPRCRNSLPRDASSTMAFPGAAGEADAGACPGSGAASEPGDLLNRRPLHRRSVAPDGYEGVW